MILIYIISAVVLAVTTGVLCMVIYLDAQFEKLLIKEYLVKHARSFARGVAFYAKGGFALIGGFIRDSLPFLNKVLEDYLRTRRPRHIFTDDLWYQLHSVLDDYRYNKLDYTMLQVNACLPSYIFINFSAQKAVTDEVAQELLRHVDTVLHQYLTAYNLPFAHFPFYYIKDNEVTVYIYYCEYNSEYHLFKTKQDQIVRNNTDPGFGTLKKDVKPKGSSQKITLGYSANAWNRNGIELPFDWNFEKVPHLLIAGITGGGKSVFTQLAVMQLLEQGVDISICDYKAGGDWSDIVSEYAEYNDCDALVDKFYASFADALENGATGRTPYFLVFDEFSSYALSKDPKDFKDLMTKIGQIALMGRSYNFHLILISQQFSAKVIDTGIREQFGIRVYMGATISTESATMLFPGCAIDKGQHLPAYHGYISTPEKDWDIIMLPQLTDPKGLKARLQELWNNHR